MTLEERLNSLKEAFTGKTAEAEAASKDAVAAKEALVAAEAKTVEAAALVEALTNDKTALAAKVGAMETELKTLAEKLTIVTAEKAALEKAAVSAGKKAAQMAADMGVDPVEVAPINQNAGGKSDGEIAEEWVAMKQKDASAAAKFYDANRPAIIRASGIK